jgi:hypothetical protein
MSAVSVTGDNPKPLSASQAAVVLVTADLATHESVEEVLAGVARSGEPLQLGDLREELAGRQLNCEGDGVWTVTRSQPALPPDPVTQTVVNYVVEGRGGDADWVTLDLVDDIPEKGEATYRHWLSGRGSLELRLVKRTAVITDVVLETGCQAGSQPDLNERGGETDGR